MSNVNLDKASWELVEVLKDTAKKNLLNAVKNDQLKLDQEILPKLFTLIDSSMSEGYNKSYKAFSTKFLKVSKDLAATADKDSLKKRK
jgi:hypothetical protein